MIYVILSILAAYFSAALVISLFLDKRRAARSVCDTGFLWGYYYILTALAPYIMLSAALIVIFLLDYMYDPAMMSLALLATVLAAISLVIICATACSRYKWALVVTTIMSLNPIYMIINYFYLRDRWVGLKSGFALQLTPSRVYHPRLSISKRNRVPLFISFAWLVNVILYETVSPILGIHYNGDRFSETLWLVFPPIASGLLLLMVYRGFVEEV